MAQATTYSKNNFKEANEHLFKVQARKPVQYVMEGEIWWCAVGLNVGLETNGKRNESGEYVRPVLIVRILGREAVLAVPMSRSCHKGKYFYQINHRGEKQSLSLHQIRCMDTRRLIRRIRKIEKTELISIREAVRNLI
ncbi:MAG: type II toxin-antitoxin system PemK/MazF family toxin [bacterium]|nr:type II toxin-antitoxin system PemK/MazF family toxin [bacterium]